MTYLPIITLVPSPIASQLPHTLIDTISLCVDAVQHHAQDICKTIHTCAPSKMQQHNIVNSVNSYFPMSGSRATVCASTRGNRHNCAPTKCGLNTMHMKLNCISIHLDAGDNLILAVLMCYKVGLYICFNYNEFLTSII